MFLFTDLSYYCCSLVDGLDKNGYTTVFYYSFKVVDGEAERHSQMMGSGMEYKRRLCPPGGTLVTKIFDRLAHRMQLEERVLRFNT